MSQPAVEANRNVLAALVEASVISRSQLERAEARLPADRVFDSPAAALHWMMLASEHVLLPHEVRIIRESAARDAMDPSAADRVAIVAQAEASLAAAGRLPARRSPDEVLGGQSAGSVLRGIATAVLVGTSVWHLLSAGAAPTCDDPDVGAKLGLAMSQAQTEAPSPYAMANPAHEARASRPQLVHPREVGYAKAVKWRGCLASIKVDDVELPVAYVLRPQHEGDGDFVVAGANADIVQARFSHIDAAGNFSNTAAPVGRAALEQAIRDGVDKFNSDAPSGADARAMALLQRERNGLPHLAHTDPDREREIADLEPNGPCRELVAGTRYSCNVLLERNDRFAAALGLGGTTASSADFTLERASAGAPWRVSDQFAAQYIEAKGSSRQGAIDGVSAALDAAAATRQ